MRAVDAMLVWTPDRDPWKGAATAGQVEVTTIPEKPDLRDHPMSLGACDQGWRDLDEAGRLRRLQQCFSHMINHDGIAEEVARAAMARIDDVRGYPFSSEKPEPSEGSEE